jgi:hypothetical protein
MSCTMWLLPPAGFAPIQPLCEAFAPAVRGLVNCLFSERFFKPIFFLYKSSAILDLGLIITRDVIGIKSGLICNCRFCIYSPLQSPGIVRWSYSEGYTHTIFSRLHSSFGVISKPVFQHAVKSTSFRRYLNMVHLFQNQSACSIVCAVMTILLFSCTGEPDSS